MAKTIKELVTIHFTNVGFGGLSQFITNGYNVTIDTLDNETDLTITNMTTNETTEYVGLHNEEVTTLIEKAVN